MEFTSPFLGTEGRTATSANHLCNLAKEHYQHLEKMLTNQSLVTKTVSIVGQNNSNILIGILEYAKSDMVNHAGEK